MSRLVFFGIHHMDLYLLIMRTTYYLEGDKGRILPAAVTGTVEGLRSCDRIFRVAERTTQHRHRTSLNLEEELRIG